MPQGEKSRERVIKLPDPHTSPKVSGDTPPYVLLNPNGGEIYKVDARYPTQPPTRQCSFTIYWTGGPADADTLIYLIDIKNWVVALPIKGKTKVVAGGVGAVRFPIPDNFKPTDDCDTSSHNPLKAGMYQIYIQDSSAANYSYGPEFTIVCAY